MNSRRERALKIKRKLYEKLRSSCDLKEVVEWAWEDFGARVKNWDDIEKLVTSSEVTIGDIVAFLSELGIEVTEEDLDLTEEDLRDALKASEETGR
ncbi:MAG: hypothetical protein QXN05_03135 [Acidilobaceae archaeon]